MTPETIAARVAGICGPLNDTERERARLLALEHQMAAVAESFDKAESCRTVEAGGVAVKRIIAALERNPELSERELVETLKVTRHAVQRARKAWGKPLKPAKRHRCLAPMTEHTLAELRRKPELLKLSRNRIAQTLGVSWDTAARAKERMANEALTESESVS